jgi:hypothetical protein
MDRRSFLKAASVGVSGALLGEHMDAISAAARITPRHRCRRNVVIDAPTDGRDVTKRILRQIAHAPDGSCIHFPRGRYRCEGSLLIEGRSHLSLHGPASIYSTRKGPLDRQGMSQRRHVWFVGCNNIRVMDLHVRSTNTKPDQREGFGAYLAEYEFEHGFAFHECVGVRLERCSTHGTWGDGLYLGNHQPTRDVYVDGLRIAYNGRQGVALSNAENVLLENVTIKNTRRAAFDLEPATPKWHVRDVEIRNCFAHGYHFTFAAMGRGDVSRIHLHHNVDQSLGGFVLCEASDGTRRSDWVIEDNTRLYTFGSPQAPLRFVNVDNVKILRNQIPISEAQSRRCAHFDTCGGLLMVCENDFLPGGCNFYESESAPVLKVANRGDAGCL